jgi:bifunctional DNA-binding transcriptional regulator/antitoxin component of YhaV-PrlF toxin-antitoxin module
MPQIYERSLIRSGDEGSCVISLPLAWLRYYGLGPGDKVDMIVNGDIIIRRKAKLENNVSEQKGSNEESSINKSQG